MHTDLLLNKTIIKEKYKIMKLCMCVARNVSRQEVGTRDTLQIVRKWRVTFSGKRDSSAEEFLTRLSEFRRGSPLSDE